MLEETGTDLDTKLKAASRKAEEAAEKSARLEKQLEDSGREAGQAAVEKITGLTSEIERLKKENAELLDADAGKPDTSGELAEARDKLAEAEAEQNRLAEKLAEAEANTKWLEDLQAELDRYRDENAELKSSLEAAAGDSEAAREAAGLREELAENKGMVSSLEEEKAAVQGELADAVSERDKLQRQANQQVSLNQGIGAFINQASQRNYARDRLKELDANAIAGHKAALEQAKLERQITQDDIQNQIGLAGLNKGRYDAQKFTAFGADGTENEGVMIVDQNTGEYRLADTSVPAQPLSPDQAMAEAQRLADEASGGIANWFTSDKDIFSGMSKDDWIQKKAQELAGGGQPATKPITATNPTTGEKIQWDGQQWVPVK
jgi:hypothetical protein